MINHTVGSINGKKLEFFQCMNFTEAKEQSLPEGIMFFWEYDGNRLDAGEVIQLMQKSILNEKNDIQKLLSAQNTEKFYNSIIQAQKESIGKQMNDLKAEYQEFGIPVDGLDQTADMIKNLKTVPDMDGMVHKTVKDTNNINSKIAGKRIRQAEQGMEALLKKNGNR